MKFTVESHSAGESVASGVIVGVGVHEKFGFCVALHFGVPGIVAVSEGVGVSDGPSVVADGGIVDVRLGVEVVNGN